jgi:hypothetical protein
MFLVLVAAHVDEDAALGDQLARLVRLDPKRRAAER